MPYMPMPQEVQSILLPFLTHFSTPVCYNAQVLAVGAILCIGRRTVTSILKVIGLGQCKVFTNFHRVLNRAHWNTLKASKILLGLLILLIPECFPLIILVDETIERRSGKKIKAKGKYRDAVRSSKAKVVNCFGLKWISMMLVVPVPWSNRPWALPFLTVLAPSKQANEAEGKRHKTTVGWTRQMIMQVRRWHPYRAIVLVGDGAYAAVSLALCCAGMPYMPVTLVSRLRLDAGLYDFPLPDEPGKRGPKSKKGKKQVSLAKRIEDPKTIWTSVEVRWYENTMRTLEIITGVSLWYTPGQDPVPVKWVVARDPKGKLRTESFFCTDVNASSKDILQWFVVRWNIEVTFEELRAHMGVETQRQWSDKAIERTTPALFGLFSLVVLMALEITKTVPLSVLSFPWYKKTEATFSDVIALVRGHIWNFKYFVKSPETPDLVNFDEDLFKIMLHQLCYRG
jgi:hypothetical protein